MKRKNLQRSGAVILVLGGLAWLGYRQSGDSSSSQAGEVKSGRGSNDSSATSYQADSGDSPLPSKNGLRVVVTGKPASEEEQKKFRRFFLPSLTFKDATIDEAMATLTQAYREAANATGEEPLDLRIDLSTAKKDEHINVTTPRGTIGPILKYLAAMSGNDATGTLPNFKLQALDQTRDKTGARPLPVNLRLEPGTLAPVGNNPPQPFIPTGPRTIQEFDDALRSLGLGDASSEISVNGNTYHYKNLSELDLQKIDATLDLNSNGGLGPGQIKTSVMIALATESYQPPESSTLTNQELQQEMRKLSMLKGTDLLTMPAVTSRSGESALIDLTHEKPGPQSGTTDWTGVRVTTSSQPLGLGQESSFHFETRSDGGEPVDIQQQMTLPEKHSGVITQRLPDGKLMMVIPTTTLIDSRGMPLAEESQ